VGNDDLGGSDRVVTSGGAAGKLPVREVHSVLVGPSLGSEFNAIELDFAPEACVRFDDVRFEFDSSFIGAETRTELKLLGKLHNEDPTRPASVFGHADPSGNDDYNKQLSGRRAQAMYGLLTRKTNLWEDLFKHPLGGDDWGNKSIQVMLTELGHYNGPINGALDGPTVEAVKAFQRSPPGAGLKVDGDPGQNTRAKLFLAYMNRLCVDENDQPFTIDPTNGFLAHGADAGGKGDFQGCSEFNPDMVFSKPEDDRFKQPANHAERDQQNKVNRRVVVYLFRSGSEIKPDSWPCPRVKEGVAGCRKRFHADGDFRRNPRGDNRRTFDVDGDTFACNFYERISNLSPCESPPVPPVIAATLEFVFDTNNDLRVDATDRPTAFVRIGHWDHAFQATGAVFNNEAEADNFVGADTRRFYLRVRDTAATGSVNVNWRTLDGSGNNLDAPADQSVTLLETGPGTKVFSSKALMLVTGVDDQRQSTHSGLPAGQPDAGIRTVGQSNHRLRRGSMLGDVIAEYTPAGGTAVVVARVPVFQRSPDERKKLPLQVFVLRVAAGGAGVISTAPGSDLWNVELPQIREIYERFGISVETVVAPGTNNANIVTDAATGDRVVLIDAPRGVNPANISFADEATIGRAFPSMPRTIRVFYAGGLGSGNRGEAWPDVDFAGQPQQGAAFSNQIAPTYNVAHEVVHILTDKRVTSNGGHYNAPTAPAGNRLHNNQNLMRNGTSVVEGVSESKRLWEAPDRDGLNQFARIIGRPSRYLRAL